MINWRNLTKFVGRNIATLGEVFGLPEMGISERVTGGALPEQTSPYITTQQGAYVSPLTQAKKPVTLPPLPTPAPPVRRLPERQVLGTGQQVPVAPATQAPAQELPAPVLAQQQTGQQISQSGQEAMQAIPQELLEPSPELQAAQQAVEQFPFEQYIQPVLDLYGEFEKTLRETTHPATLSGIETEREKVMRGIETTETGAYAKLGRQQEREEGRTALAIQGIKERKRSAVGEAQSQYDEIQQGMQSLYGGTTGTGKFAGELAYRSANRNIANIRGAAMLGIAQNQAALTNVIAEIVGARGNIETEAMRQVADINTWAQQQQKEARASMEEQLNRINLARAESEATKADKRLALLQDTRNFLAGLDTQSKQLQQQVFLGAQQQADKLEFMEAQANQDFQTALKTATMIPTPNVSVFTPQQALAAGQIPSTAQIISPTEGTGTAPRIRTEVITIGGKKKLINSDTGELIADLGEDIKGIETPSPAAMQRIMEMIAEGQLSPEYAEQLYGIKWEGETGSGGIINKILDWLKGS